ncbi:MAG: hypothetical protein ACJ72M_19085 [Propionibacteriaceae bacterium]
MTDVLTRSLADAHPEVLIGSVPFADLLGRWLLDAMLEFKGAEFQGPEIP